MAYRHYTKEEEFVDEFYNWASVAAAALNHEWSPNPDCNDAVRSNQNYFMESRELNRLVFESASVTKEGGVVTSAQIVLESADRQVTVKVTTRGGEPEAEILLNKKKGE